MDERKYQMVEYLDEPERILFFTVEEFVGLMFPMGVGIQSEHGLLGMVVGVSLCGLIRRFKSKEGAGFLQRIMYWHFPGLFNRLRRAPSASVRRYMG